MAKKPKQADAGLSQSPTHLLHRVLQLALDFHGEASGPAGLTQRQYTVLAAAGAADGVSQSDLVRATGIDRSTLADLVARMLAKGLLERERSTSDARANTVRVSNEGRTALTDAGRPVAQSDARLMSLLPPKKREAFLKTLTTLAAAADVAGGARPLAAQAAGAPNSGTKASEPRAKSAKKKSARKKQKKAAKKQAKAAAA